MDYARFVRLRRPAWDGFEARLRAARASPASVDHGALEGLAVEYRQVLHDHALARVRYPGTAAAERLHSLAVAGTHWLHAEPDARRGGLATFFRRRFPLAFRRLSPYFGAAAALFAAAAVLGLSLAWVDVSVGLALLGPGAEERLRQGRLWTESLTTTVPPAVSSSAIATNNMAVALSGWAGGAVGGLGTLYVCLLNGFMLGAVISATSHFGLASELLEFVAAHGPLEITLILVTAGAGLAMGRSLLAAEDRPRREVVREAAAEALVVLLGCLPWFLVLGLVEGFLSPSPDLDASLKAALGLALEAVFLTLAWNPFLKEGP